MGGSTGLGGQSPECTAPPTKGGRARQGCTSRGGDTPSRDQRPSPFLTGRRAEPPLLSARMLIAGSGWTLRRRRRVKCLRLLAGASVLQTGCKQGGGDRERRRSSGDGAELTPVQLCCAVLWPGAVAAAYPPPSDQRTLPRKAACLGCHTLLLGVQGSGE